MKKRKSPIPAYKQVQFISENLGSMSREDIQDELYISRATFFRRVAEVKKKPIYDAEAQAKAEEALGRLRTLLKSL